MIQKKGLRAPFSFPGCLSLRGPGGGRLRGYLPGLRVDHHPVLDEDPRFPVRGTNVSTALTKVAGHDPDRDGQTEIARRKCGNEDERVKESHRADLPYSPGV